MQHSFHSSQIDPSLCMICKRDEQAHSIFATCECCSNVGPCNIYMTMLMCASCESTERAAQALSQSQKSVAERLAAISRDDATINYTKFFNNNTVSIPELIELIKQDDSIPIDEKKYALSRQINDRMRVYRHELIELNKQKLEKELASNQLQIELNKLVPQLQEKYRSEFAQSDINYKPTAIKTVKTPKAGFDKSELKKVANQFNIPEYILQTLVVQKKMSIPDAARLFIKMNNAQDDSELIPEAICSCSETPGMCKIHPK